MRLVIERSQSMSRRTARWQQAIAAAHTIVDRLEPDDTLSIISYAGEARFEVQPRPMRSHYGVHEALDALQPTGETGDPSDAGRLVHESWPRRRNDDDIGLVVMISASDDA